MLIGVAGVALRGEAEISMVQILYANAFTFARRHVIRSMATAANNSGMRALENVAGPSMVELVVGRFPFDDVELRTKVVRVASGALLIATDILYHPGVEAPVICQPVPDFRVATGAPKFSGT